jgi:hypothetical protein
MALKTAFKQRKNFDLLMVVLVHNELRPHYSNFMLTTNQMHSQTKLK